MVKIKYFLVFSFALLTNEYKYKKGLSENR